MFVIFACAKVLELPVVVTSKNYEIKDGVIIQCRLVKK